MSILFWVVSADFSGAGVCLRPAGGFPSLSPVASAFSLLFCPLSPQPALAERSSPVGKGETKVILCKGLRPLHPRAELGLNGNRKGAPVPSGGFPSLSPAAPAFRFDFAPIPPPPFPAGRGRPRLFYARGFAPCIPGLNPRGTGSTCRCRRLNGGRAPPSVAGSVSVSGARRGLAFFVARRP